MFRSDIMLRTPIDADARSPTHGKFAEQRASPISGDGGEREPAHEISEIESSIYKDNRSASTDTIWGLSD
jgi:hypothetical protein